MQSRKRNEAPTLTFCDYTCVCCGGSGVATEGVGGRGTLYGGHHGPFMPKKAAQF